jgi:SH3-like domain-containing protein
MRDLARPFAVATLAAVLATVPASAAPTRQSFPYYASISAGRARMRTGPAHSYPSSWLYQRADLPVRVIGTFKEWRHLQDPDGTQGWMLGNLISSTRTAIVRGTAPAAMLDRPATGAAVRWRAAPGVVGRISHCGSGWCRLDVKGQAGFVEVAELWGVEPGETLP